MPEITVQSSKLSSVFPKKNPMVHSDGLSSDTANASATTLFDCNTQEPTGRTRRTAAFMLSSSSARKKPTA